MSGAPPNAGDAEVEVHKPKPFHDWREFVSEISIVVIGVLIALAGEQAVETLHWQHEIALGQEALKENARQLIYSAAVREAESPCLGRRLTAVAHVLDQASANGKLPAVGQLGAPSLAPWSWKTWDNLVASQVAVHLDREKMLSYSSIARRADILFQQNTDEHHAWSELYTIVGPGRSFGDAEQAATRAALSRAVLRAKEQLWFSKALQRAFVDSNLVTANEIKTIRTDAWRNYQIAVREGIMCKPLDQTPKADTYGQAPSPVDLSQPFKP